MNYKFLALLACASLAACGGGGGSGTATTDPVTPTPTVSAAELEAVKVFAETYTASQLVQGVLDLQLLAGKSGNCPSGGTTAYSAATQKQTMTNCRRDMPNLFTYQGNYDLSNVNLNLEQSTMSFNGGLKALNPTDLTKTLWTLTGGTVSGDNTSQATSDRTTTIYTSTANFTVGSSTYNFTKIAGDVTNNYTSQLFYPTMTFQKSSVSYDTYVPQPLNIVNNGNPSSGRISLTYAGAKCVPMNIVYKSVNDIDLECGTAVYAKKWTDADIVAAITAAQQ